MAKSAKEAAGGQTISKTGYVILPTGRVAQPTPSYFGE